jgi:hypothetical protein
MEIRSVHLGIAFLRIRPYMKLKYFPLWQAFRVIYFFVVREIVVVEKNKKQCVIKTF